MFHAVWKLVPARCRVKVTLRHTCITSPQVTSHNLTSSNQAQARPEERDKGVHHFLKQKKHFLSLALTLTRTLTISNFERPCTLFHLMCTCGAWNKNWIGSWPDYFTPPCAKSSLGMRLIKVVIHSYIQFLSLLTFQVGPTYGRKTMTGLLASQGLCVSQQRVGESLRRMNPTYHHARRTATHGNATVGT